MNTRLPMRTVFGPMPRYRQSRTVFSGVWIMSANCSSVNTTGSRSAAVDRRADLGADARRDRSAGSSGGGIAAIASATADATSSRIASAKSSAASRLTAAAYRREVRRWLTPLTCCCPATGQMTRPARGARWPGPESRRKDGAGPVQPWPGPPRHFRWRGSSAPTEPPQCSCPHLELKERTHMKLDDERTEDHPEEPPPRRRIFFP